MTLGRSSNFRELASSLLLLVYHAFIGTLRLPKFMIVIPTNIFCRLADLAPAHFQSGESLDPSIAVGRHSWAYRGLVLRGSLEMSTFSQGTIFPYARYIRVLNLQDLASLLDEIASFSVSKRKELQYVHFPSLDIITDRLS